MSSSDPVRSAEVLPTDDTVCDVYYTMEGVQPVSEPKHSSPSSPPLKGRHQRNHPNDTTTTTTKAPPLMVLADGSSRTNSGKSQTDLTPTTLSLNDTRPSSSTDTPSKRRITTTDGPITDVLPSPTTPTQSAQETYDDDSHSKLYSTSNLTLGTVSKSEPSTITIDHHHSVSTNASSTSDVGSNTPSSSSSSSIKQPPMHTIPNNNFQSISNSHLSLPQTHTDSSNSNNFYSLQIDNSSSNNLFNPSTQLPQTLTDNNSTNTFFATSQPQNNTSNNFFNVPPTLQQSTQMNTSNNFFAPNNLQQPPQPIGSNTFYNMLTSLQPGNNQLDSNNFFATNNLQQVDSNNTLTQNSSSSSNNFFTSLNNTGTNNLPTALSTNMPLSTNNIPAALPTMNNTLVIPQPNIHTDVPTQNLLSSQHHTPPAHSNMTPRSVSPKAPSPSLSPNRLSPIHRRTVQTESNFTSAPQDESPHSSMDSTVLPSSNLGLSSSQQQNNFFLTNHQSRKEIGLPSMKSFIELVIKPIPTLWREFGIALGIKSEILDEFERKFLGEKPISSFTEVFKYWENNKNELRPFLWKTVADILSSPQFNCPLVVQSISSQCLPYSQTDGPPTPPSSSSLPSKLNEQSSTPPLPPSSLSSLDLQTPRKSFSPSTNVLPSPNVPYDTQTLPNNNITTTNVTIQPQASNVPCDASGPNIQPYNTHVTNISSNVSIQPQTSNVVPYDANISPYNAHVPSNVNIQPHVPYDIQAQSNLPPQSGFSSINVQPSSNQHTFIRRSNSTGSSSDSNNFYQPSNYSGSISTLSGHLSVPGIQPSVSSEMPLVGGTSQIIHPQMMTAGTHHPYPPLSQPSLGNPSNPQLMQTPFIPRFQLNPQFIQGTPQFSTLQPNPQLLAPMPQGMAQGQLQPHQLIRQLPQPQLKETFPQIPQDPYSQLMSDDSSTNTNPTQGTPLNYHLPNQRQEVPYSSLPSQPPHSVYPTGLTTALPIHTPISLPVTNSTELTSTVTNPPPPITTTAPLLTGYTVITTPVPVSTASTGGLASSSQLIGLSQSTLIENKEDKSSSTFYSAADTEETRPAVIPKPTEDPWRKLVQKYMHYLEHKSVAPQPSSSKLPLRPSSGHSSLPSRQRGKSQKDETSLIQKELEKAYERISSLEVRVQDLTAQVSSDIPEDKDLSLLSRDKLEEEFKKMRELKKKAEQMNMDSKQSAQRLITENFRLKEELSQSRNECDMLIADMRSQRRKLFAKEQIREEKMEVIKKSLKESAKINLQDLDLSSPSANSLTADVSEYPPMDFTPNTLFNAIISQKDSILTVGQVGVVGLPCSGKSTLLNALLKNEIDGKLTKPRGRSTCIEFHEVMSAKNPLTGDSQWKMSSGTDTAVQYLASITAQYYYRNKCVPSFTSNSNDASFAKLFPDITDMQMKTTLNEIYRQVCALLQEEKKRDSMTQLALFQSVFMNIWDVGVNLCLYQFLPVVAGQCEHLVLLNVLDLERDVPNLDEPPIMSGKESYKKRGDSDSVMRLYSRGEYLMMMAGLKRWFNKNPANLTAPEVVFVGTYTKELRERSPKAIEELTKQLNIAITALSTQFEIEGAIDRTILTYCIDGDKALQNKELTQIKKTLERVTAAQPNFRKPFDPKWMLYRSLFYNPSSLAVTLEELAKVGRFCGIPSRDKFNQCLKTFRNVGSLLYNPEIKCTVAQTHVILDIPRVFDLLDKLFYLGCYNQSGPLVLSTDTMDKYQHGLVSKSLAEKVFTRQDYFICLEYLTCCKVCVEVTVESEVMYYLPSLRKRNYVPAEFHKDSLYIQYHSHYSQCDQLILFHKWLPKAFSGEQEKITFVPRIEHNVTSFCYDDSENGKNVLVEVIYHPKIIEVHVSSADREKDKEGNVLNMSLCSKLLLLCKEVYQEVCQDIQNLTYEFSLMCVNCNASHNTSHYTGEEEDKGVHFVNFHVNYKSQTLYCQKCQTDVTFNDDRSNWLTSHVN